MSGVHCEAIPHQVNFRTDESGEVGKGANAMISRLHYFSDVHGLGGQLYWQNKNNAMINYLMWRVMDDTQTLRTHFS